MDKLASMSPKMAASLAQTHNQPNDLRAAAEQFEALFIQQLLKQARSAQLADDILGSEAGDTYTEMLDQERARQLSTQIDLGIAEALVQQFGGLTSNNLGDQEKIAND
jgi:flagellar protein FlgJ